MVNQDYSTHKQIFNSPVLVQPAQLAELVYTPDLTYQAEQAELLSRYFALLAEDLRILTLLEGGENEK